MVIDTKTNTRKLVTFSREQLEQVKSYQLNHGLDSESEAIRQLIWIALEKEEDR